MKCDFQKPRLGAWLNLAWSIFALIVVVSLTYSFYRAVQPPLKITGYRIGVDNQIWPGQKVSGIVVFDRLDARRCRTQVKISMTAPSMEWQTGTLFEMVATPESVEHVERRTPGQFAFTFTAPDSLPFGQSVLIGDAEFKCDGNPVQELFPARVSIAAPLTVINQ